MNNSPLFSMKYIPMQVSLVSMETGALPPFLGSTLRGVLGQALYDDRDAFNYLYEQRKLGARRDTVNPYVICPPPLNEAGYHPGEELRFKIYLLGDAMRYVESVVDALCKIQEFGFGAGRHSFSLAKVTHSSTQRVIWKNGVLYAGALTGIVLPHCDLPAVKQLTIRMLTPLRIRRGGELLSHIDFQTIIRNITRRIEALVTRYGGWVDRAEIRKVQELSTEICTIRECLELKSLKRYSTRLSEKMDFSGLLGTVEFEGCLSPFVPWLYAAQILHIGRNTTFGMGRIEVEFI